MITTPTQMIRWWTALPANVGLFVLFRLGFTVRFYYPVFTVLFLDFGLTLEQFTLLNIVWAATIVLLEVPSGGLADTLGRRKLLLIAGGCMMVEIALIAFIPFGNTTLIFAAFLINRILSGAAEAAASGADEALAYDSLKEVGLESRWANVLERLMRYQAAAFVIALLLGAAVYDATLMNRLGAWLGFDIALRPETTLRWPLYLSLASAVFITGIAWRMRETGSSATTRIAPSVIRQTLHAILTAARWIKQTPEALLLVMAGLVFDSVIRLFLTLASQYYRVISYPEAAFGVIGAALSLLGLFAPRLARHLVEYQSAVRNFIILGVITFIGLWGLSLVWTYGGVLFAALLYLAMYWLNYFLSVYLNRITASDQRATVLSFKGLAFNLGYGFIGLLYLGWLQHLSPHHATPDGPDSDLLFIDALSAFPLYFLVTFSGLALLAWCLLRKKRPSND